MTARTDIDSDRLIAALDARVDRREQRRAFFRDALGAMAVTGALGLASGASAQSTPTPTATPTPTYTDQDILNFALNLEYLEAQFYAYATTGAGISSSLLGGAGTAGSVNATGAAAVPFADPIIARYAREIAADEVAHVTFLRNALGSSTVVAQPALDLSVGPNSAFSAAAVAAKIITAGQTFNPYANEDAFLLAAFIFEDVGVTAYKGAAGALINNKTYLEAAAGILAVEAYHAALVRTALYARGLNVASLRTAADSISNLRDSVDGSTDLDQGISPTTQSGNLVSNIVPLDSNGLAFSRTPAQTLNVVYLNRSAVSSGGFFPAGINNGNAAIRTSGAN